MDYILRIEHMHFYNLGIKMYFKDCDEITHINIEINLKRKSCLIYNS